MAEPVTGEIRVRIAPSPTGPFHIGRSRAALLNWLFARRYGGTFVLRVEDTDQKRSDHAHMQGILDSLRWLGLQWDEGPDVGGPYGPYFQMGRLDTYTSYAQTLLEDGNAYRCYCTSEELDALRETARRDKQAFRYPRTCRHLSEEQRQARERHGHVPVVRLMVPEDGETTFDDMLLGPITVRHRELDDFVIMKSDGIPAYNFAVVIDDLTMKITHVIRGQDHVPNTPKQIQVYQMLGHPIPRFGHLPLVQGMDGKKISARYGAKAVVGMGEEGYLPEAVFNYVATVGVSYEAEREIYSREELIGLFDIERIGKSGAAFDEDKLDWINGTYIRALPLDEFVQRSLPFLQLREFVSPTPSAEELDYVRDVLRLEQERVKTLAEVPHVVEFFFQDVVAYDPAQLVQKKSSLEEAKVILGESLAVLEQVEPFQHDPVEQAFRAMAERLELKTGTVFGTLRVAITGRTAAPPLFDTMIALGNVRVAGRIEQALRALGATSPAG